jgi:hypothetical protein
MRYNKTLVNTTLFFYARDETGAFQKAFAVFPGSPSQIWEPLIGIRGNNYSGWP